MTHPESTGPAHSPALGIADSSLNTQRPPHRRWSRLGAATATASLAVGMMVAVAAPASAATLSCGDIADGLRLARSVTVSGCTITFSADATIDLNGYTLSVVTSNPLRVSRDSTLHVVGGGHLQILSGRTTGPSPALRILTGGSATVDANLTVVGSRSSGDGGAGVEVSADSTLIVNGNLDATGGKGANGDNGVNGTVTSAPTEGDAGWYGGAGVEVRGVLRVDGTITAKGGDGGNGGTGGSGGPAYSGANGGRAGESGSGIITRGTVFASGLIQARAGSVGTPGAGGARGTIFGAGSDGAAAFAPVDGALESASAAVMSASAISMIRKRGTFGTVRFLADRDDVTPSAHISYAGSFGAAIAALPAGWPARTGFLGWVLDDGTTPAASTVPTLDDLHARWAEIGTPPDPGAPGDPGTPGGSCVPFSDVSASDANCGDIAWLKAQGLVSATTTTFRPDGAVTRGQFVTFLFKLVNPGTTKPKCLVKPFKDVKKKSAVCGYVKWAKDNGIITGASSSKFKASAAVTRGAAAAYLYRMTHSGKNAPACKAKPFKDVGKKSANCGSIKWMKKSGIDTGVTVKKYKPGTVLTRGAAASTLHALDDDLA